MSEYESKHNINSFCVCSMQDVEEFEDFAKKTNEHFEEIDSFVMMVE